jgi:hypothetical protein
VLRQLLSCHSATENQSQNKINEEDYIIRKKYIVNHMKTVIPGCHGITVEDGLLGCYAVWLGNAWS